MHRPGSAAVADALVAMTMRLPYDAAQALADVLPLLACGEKAAATAFSRLADDHAFSSVVCASLERIAAEEDVHFALLTGLAATLPPARVDPAQRRTSQHFHARLTQGGAVVHLARIAAIDAAVCTILSRILSRTTPIGNAPMTASLFAQIRRDESRHVAIARAAIEAAPDRLGLRDEATRAREGLAALLEPVGAAFAALKVDPDALLRDVRRLPNRLL